MPHPEHNPLEGALLQLGHRQLLHSALAALSEGLVIADARGTLVYSSPDAEQLVGPSGMEQLPLWQALKGEEVQELELFIRNGNMPEGRRVRCNGIPLRDEQGQVIGGMSLVKGLDEAGRSEDEKPSHPNEEFERRIAERTAQLEFANREMESFAYSVAHDLRAPLRAITSFSEALTDDCAAQLDATGQDYLRRILGSTQRMSELIDGILALSRVHRTPLVSTRCDLTALAKAVSEQLQVQYPGRTVHLTLQEGLVDRGDSQLLRSVLENLLGNAWKFTRERPVAEIEFGVTQEQGRRTYFVKDNGAGFDMAYQHKLFGVFQRLHSQAEFEGNGVGLATVQRIIRRHSGHIWGEGQPGQGACFFFTLNELPHLSAPRAPREPNHD
ncbi:ATP-binding protein [Hyalangium minutum]|uniref:histidine kinase n=1 Tax=Hyalangium minutum TaxID=394096 RepID=A0A085WW97_9BACT|nr:ATP-binding protein [Hyalangium minutum]KFE71960.1 Sensory box histidine kinase [Hyalangium minutum]